MHRILSGCALSRSHPRSPGVGDIDGTSSDARLIIVTIAFANYDSESRRPSFTDPDECGRNVGNGSYGGSNRVIRGCPARTLTGRAWSPD